MKFAFSAALALATPAVAQDKPAGESGDQPAKVAQVVPQVVTTQHSGTFGGVRMRYSATIGETIVTNKEGVQEVAVVTTAYVKEPRDANRPVTFLFNGGPGSGSVWL